MVVYATNYHRICRGGSLTLPVVLLRKTTSPQAINAYFPSGNPEILCISGGTDKSVPYDSLAKQPFIKSAFDIKISHISPPVFSDAISCILYLVSHISYLISPHPSSAMQYLVSCILYLPLSVCCAKYTKTDHKSCRASAKILFLRRIFRNTERLLWIDKKMKGHFLQK